MEERSSDDAEVQKQEKEWEGKVSAFLCLSSLLLVLNSKELLPALS
jgi:hypothetical protein